MIKINLAKDSNIGIEDSGSFVESIRSFKLDRERAKKLIFILNILIGLILYERYNLYDMNKKLRESTNKLNGINQKIIQYGDVSSAVLQLQEQKKEMFKQLEVIRKVSKKRKLKIDSITKIQEFIPEDVWISEINFDKSKIIFSGYTRKASSVQGLVKNLSETGFVDLVVNMELKRVSGKDNLQTFDIDLDLK